MARKPVKARPSPGARRFGYLLAIVVNAVLLYLLLVRPGWEAVPVLTGEADRVMGWVGASFGVGILANLVFLARDPVWLKATGDLVTTVVGLVATWRVWQVFPFDFSEISFDAALVVRILLVVALVGGVIGILAAVGTIVKDRRLAPRR